MFEVVGGKAEGNLVGLRISGKLTKQELDEIGERAQALAEAQGKLRLVVIMDDFHGWDSVKAAWEDLKLEGKLNKHVERVAMVGDKDWQRISAKLMTPFTKGEVKYFERTQEGDAWAWAKGEGHA
ncbi:STAS/SEC14 domain-containing protein [bacterium]|nr:STAS/SEC14 domain-containing protein [bacterium]